MTHVPSGPIGCAWADHFAWQKRGGNFKQGETFFCTTLYSFQDICVEGWPKRWTLGSVNMKRKIAFLCLLQAIPVGMHLVSEPVLSNDTAIHHGRSLVLMWKFFPAGNSATECKCARTDMPYLASGARTEPCSCKEFHK